MHGLSMSVSQLRITPRIRIVAFIVTLLFSARYKNVWKIVVKYAMSYVGEMFELMPVMQYCPQPRNAEEHSLQDEEDKSYVRNRIAYVTSCRSRSPSMTAFIHRFIDEDPGRQSISGSFNPIDEGEWSESAYIQAAAKFFGAISQNDAAAVTQMIEAGEDPNRRDHVGRTP